MDTRGIALSNDEVEAARTESVTLSLGWVRSDAVTTRSAVLTGRRNHVRESAATARMIDDFLLEAQMSWLMAPHDPEWAAQYEDEASRLREVFGRELVAIHHVGSTAIPGIKAKPIIDIVIVIEDIRRIHAFHEAMIALGYRPRGEGKDPFRTPGRFYFNKPHCNIHTHHAHVMQAGHLDIEAKLNFRDYLRAHPEEARAYSDLKARLTAENTQGIGEYMEGKDAFVKGIIARAKQWKAQEPQRS